MEDKAEQFSDRLIDYGVQVTKLTIKLEKTETEKYIASQLLQSGTSVGTNYEDARGAVSRDDFIQKLRICLKAANESLYWLKLVQKSGILKGKALENVIDETKQLRSIIAKSVVTEKKNK